jgi:hypothetical protein
MQSLFLATSYHLEVSGGLITKIAFWRFLVKKSQYATLIYLFRFKVFTSKHISEFYLFCVKHVLLNMKLKIVYL